MKPALCLPHYSRLRRHFLRCKVRVGHQGVGGFATIDTDGLIVGGCTIFPFGFSNMLILFVHVKSVMIYAIVINLIMGVAYEIQ